MNLEEAKRWRKKMWLRRCKKRMPDIKRLKKSLKFKELPHRNYMTKLELDVATYMDQFRCCKCKSKISAGTIYYNGGWGMKIDEKCLN